MSQITFALGSDIYTACVEGAKRKFNRSTDNHKAYEEVLSESYKFYLDQFATREDRRRINRKTKGNWRNAYLPVCLAMKHKHIGGLPSEDHARIYFPHSIGSVIDIPWSNWVAMERTSSLLNK
jgi:hypothetical protein